MTAAADDWGRVPGLRPPLPAWAPLAWFAALAAVLGAVVLGLVRGPGPLDQADLGYQRDGLLIDGPVLPSSVAGVSFGERPVVLLFERGMPGAERFATWREAVPARAAVVVVLPDDAGQTLPGAQVVADPAGDLAAAVDLPAPVGGGRGIGYAVVDSRRQLRYLTLDPTYLEHGFELTTMVGAVR